MGLDLHVREEDMSTSIMDLGLGHLIMPSFSVGLVLDGLKGIIFKLIVPHSDFKCYKSLLHGVLILILYM